MNYEFKRNIFFCNIPFIASLEAQKADILAGFTSWVGESRPNNGFFSLYLWIMEVGPWSNSIRKRKWRHPLWKAQQRAPWQWHLSTQLGPQRGRDSDSYSDS